MATFEEVIQNKVSSHRSIRELIDEIEDAMGVVETRIQSLKKRLDEFYRLQNEFYVGENK